MASERPERLKRRKDSVPRQGYWHFPDRDASRGFGLPSIARGAGGVDWQPRRTEGARQDKSAYLSRLMRTGSARARVLKLVD